MPTTTRLPCQARSRSETTFFPTRATWPALPDVLGPARTRRLFHRVRYQLLKLLTGPQRHLLLQTLDRHPAWAHMLDVDRRSFYVFYRRYLDRRLSIRQRFHAMIADLEAAATHFGPVTAHLLANGGSVRVCAQAQFSVDLTINAPTRIEGYWALNLNAEDGQPLFNLSFGFLDADSLLIASLQGLKRSDGHNRQIIRSLTKRSHGLRPHALLLEILRMCCTAWGISRIHGIDPAYQVTQYKKKRDEFGFDYRVFWQEHGADLASDGHWRLPSHGLRRAAADIPMQKRAMYRRRYEMLDELGRGVVTALAAPAFHEGAASKLAALQRKS